MDRSAAIGAVVWLGCAAAGGPLGAIEILFLLAPLVLVPLALGALEKPERLRALRYLQPGAALLATGSFFVPRGTAAGALAGAWLALTLLLAERGVERLRAEWTAAVALLALPVGGAWLTISRVGLTPMGFEEPIVLLTAIHFHYAAFTTLALLALARRWTPDHGLTRATAVAAAVGTPLLAAGITFSPHLEVAGATLLSLALWTFAGILWRRVAPRVPPLSRGLVRIAALSVLPSMALPPLYAWGQLTGEGTVSLARMAAIHGPLNALGFGLCGLLAFRLAASPCPAVPVYEDRRERC
jgi:hypothetical protein